MNEDEMPREDDFSNAPVPSRAESAGWVVLRSDHSVVLYDPDNMSLTVRRGRAGRGTLSDRAQEPRGRRRAPRLLQNLDAADTEELAEEDNEMLSDRDRSLVRAHTPHHARARCALCHQTLPEGMSIPSPTETRSTPDSHFIHNQYFRLLAGTSEELKELAQPERKTFRTRKATNGTSAAESEGLSSKSYNDGYYERFFVETQKLGRGFRGSVFLCQHVLDGIALNEYAVKKVPVGESHAWLARMLKEVQLLERLQHPNVVDYKHAWIEHHSPTVYGPPVPTLFVLMNLANGGNLEDYICIQHDALSSGTGSLTPKEILRMRRQQAQNVSQIQSIGLLQTWQSSSAVPQRRSSVAVQQDPAQLRGGIGWAANIDGSPQVPSRRVRYLTHDQIWSMFLDITRGLAHLHRNKIVHRDLKPPNLLLQYADPTQRHLELCPRVLISDFGECEILSEQEQDRRRSGATGTLEFTAPELLSGDGNGSVEEGIHADLWALGMVLYFLCFSRLPWSQVDDVDQLREEIVSTAASLPIPEEEDVMQEDELGPRVSKELTMLMRLLLNPVGSKRPSAQWILDCYEGGSGRPGWARPRRTNESEP